VGSSNIPSRLMLRKPDKLWADRPLGSYADFTYLPHQQVDFTTSPIKEVPLESEVALTSFLGPLMFTPSAMSAERKLIQWEFLTVTDHLLFLLLCFLFRTPRNRLTMLEL